MANTLFLALQGPLQSWGARTLGRTRQRPFPTKSGIVGLLGCALGWADDAQLVDLSASIEVGVRADLPGVLLTDYHTVVSGVLSASGKVKRSASTRSLRRSSPGETTCATRPSGGRPRHRRANRPLCRRRAAARLAALSGAQVMSAGASAVRGARPLPPWRPRWSAWPRLVPSSDGSAPSSLPRCPSPTGRGCDGQTSLSRARRVFGVRSVRRVQVRPPERKEDGCTSPD